MPFQLITPNHLVLINDLVKKIPESDIAIIHDDLAQLIDQIKNDIPEKRRISTGRYSVVKALGTVLFDQLKKANISVLDIAPRIINVLDGDGFVKSTAIQLISLYGMETSDLDSVLPHFTTAAANQDWIVRECASGLIRKLVKKDPDQMREWYLKMVKSEDPNQRRFVSESLRPVVENRWFHQSPEYALDIIQHLFQESAPYPRTSVGNSLSDWMRIREEVAWPIVEELTRSGNKNSYWIAYRACRNLVKKEPLRVMELLNIEEYKYKNRKVRKADYL